MQTSFRQEDLNDPRLQEVDRILRSCVHCGFCNATCPTYQLLGDERDGPRGRIYLMKTVFENTRTPAKSTAETRLHLDRCLTCRNCETTCPSGVEYHKLLDLGREEMERRVPRSILERGFRYLLRRSMTQPVVASSLFGFSRWMRPLLPGSLREKVPPKPVPSGQRPLPNRHSRQMLLLEGCVQPSLSPNTNAATARVLDRLGIGLIESRAGCCGALDYHLNAQADGLQCARHNIDAWWPALEEGAQAIIQTASGCGAFVKEYGYLLRQDPDYAEKAALVSAKTFDLVEILAKEPIEKLGVRGEQRLAFHPPCTLQHAQRLSGAVEGVLERLGYTLTKIPDRHLCCGSAGTYSITQPQLARQLRERKLRALESDQPHSIVTANIGCQIHLSSGASRQIQHWIERIDADLPEKEEQLTPSAP